MNTPNSQRDNSEEPSFDISAEWADAPPEKRAAIRRLLAGDAPAIDLLADTVDDTGIQAILTSLRELDTLADGTDREAIPTLERVHQILADIRLRLGERLATVFNRWEGYQWTELDTCKTIVSIMDELATSLGLEFQVQHASKGNKPKAVAGSLRAAASGRDQKPTIRLQSKDGKIQASFRTFKRIALSEPPRDSRRRQGA